jgi:hypothetical protein
MTGDAIRARFFSLMAVQAFFHGNINMPRRRPRGFADPVMTRGAIQSCRDHMTTVRKIDIWGEPVEPSPLDLLSGFYELNESLLRIAFPDRLSVAVLARFQGRPAGRVVILKIGMAVQTIHFVFLVDLVIKFKRLRYRESQAQREEGQNANTQRHSFEENQKLISKPIMRFIPFNYFLPNLD